LGNNHLPFVKKKKDPDKESMRFGRNEYMRLEEYKARTNISNEKGQATPKQTDIE
jgi:hypothetical protein